MASALRKSKTSKRKKPDLLFFERKLKKKGFDLIIGVDEAGRGPLAGPVVAAAVALKSSNFVNRIDDSKKLTPKLREKALLEINAKSISGISIVSHKVIDRINILEATKLAMRSAVLSLIKKIKDLESLRIHVIVDGNFIPDLGLPCTAIIKGDAKSMSIACASILAKVTRDRIMEDFDSIYPQYGFAKHKGYPTKAHREVLRRIGPSVIHRKSFHYV
ncbi:MAG: ribonuclease HII [Candidatus Omnitrophica bacterium]|nr:ribonuclease HII [Candidatus Omnitrophota bacterium]